MNDESRYIESLQALMPWGMPLSNWARLRYMLMRSLMISNTPLHRPWLLHYLLGMTRRSNGPSRASSSTS